MKAASRAKLSAKIGLDEVVQSAHIRSTFNSFILSNEGELRGLLKSSYAKPALIECFKYKNADATVTFRGLVVQSCSIFEVFTKATIMNAIDEIVGEASEAAEIDRTFIVRNFMVTAGYMKSARDKFYEGCDNPKVADAVRNLANLEDTNSKPQFNSFAFVHDMGNCNVKTFDSYFESALLKDAMGQISKTDALKNFYKTRSAADAKSLATRFLNDTMRKRNRIVHENCMSETVVLQDVIDTCGFFTAVMDSVDEWLQPIAAKSLLVSG